MTDLPDFETFWQAFPRKVAKKDAQKAWEQLRPDRDLQQRILDAIEWQRQQPQWLKDGGQFIPYPASWIRAERWDDEPMESPQWTAKTTHSVAAVKRWLQH